MPGENNKLIIADADILVALAYSQDANHQKAISLITRLAEKLYQIRFPNTAILETITALKRGLDQPALAQKINRDYRAGAFDVIYVDEAIQIQASEIFTTLKSKKNTIFDAVIVATGKLLSADAILSFDKWYTTTGIPLAQSLV